MVGEGERVEREVEGNISEFKVLKILIVSLVALRVVLLRRVLEVKFEVSDVFGENFNLSLYEKSELIRKEEREMVKGDYVVKKFVVVKLIVVRVKFKESI